MVVSDHWRDNRDQRLLFERLLKRIFKRPLTKSERPFLFPKAAAGLLAFENQFWD
jgi:hypothetical protein